MASLTAYAQSKCMLVISYAEFIVSTSDSGYAILIKVCPLASPKIPRGILGANFMPTVLFVFFMPMEHCQCM